MGGAPVESFGVTEARGVSKARKSTRINGAMTNLLLARHPAPPRWIIAQLSSGGPSTRWAPRHLRSVADGGGRCRANHQIKTGFLIFKFWQILKERRDDFRVGGGKVFGFTGVAEVVEEFLATVVTLNDESPAVGPDRAGLGAPAME